MTNAASFKRAMDRNPHLKEYVANFVKKTGKMPAFHVQLQREFGELDEINLIYPVGDPIFIHIIKNKGEAEIKYYAIEPKFSAEVRDKYNRLRDRMLAIIPRQLEPSTSREFKFMLDQMLADICVIGEEEKHGLSKFFGKKEDKISVTPEEFEMLRYKLMKDMAGLGILEPFIRDHYIEDIHCCGIGNIFIFHKIFKLVETNVGFFYERDLNEYCYRISELMDKPISKARPIIDGTLPDGSRINIIYGRDISKRGSSFTIRKFAATPISITQLIAWNTYSAQLAAYLWLCVEHGMSIFICGETASGKTTSLNAITCFIKPKAKILSAEDTPEINVPHENWQQLITRASLTKERITYKARVEMADLLKAALHSRPDYIIIGEIRGREGAIAFQAMQTGHPVMSTFHASSIRRMIQRFNSNPINVPQSAMDSLNVALFQQALYLKGRLARRVTTVVEVEGYSPESKGIRTRKIFEWIPRDDSLIFEGLYNSYVLEDKIATALGYEDTKEIYDELVLRTRILEGLVKARIFDYHEVFEVMKSYSAKGLEGLPAKLKVVAET
jgi:flagellar protein FlaI